MERRFPASPLVGVGAVVFDGDRVLLIKRARPPSQGEWSLPGGAVELGETLASALQREVLEETGLVVQVGRLIRVLERIYTDGDGRVEYHYVLIDYRCDVIGGTLQHASDADAAVWVPLEGLTGMLLTGETESVVREAFAQP
ncbi:MAG: NUDIX hydrolase [Vicinamibacterales bacterium]